MRTSVTALLLVTLVACGCSSKAKGTTGPGASGTGASGSAASGSAASGSAATPALADLGSKCGDADACPAGLECVSYYGVAGASGPEFKSCEKKCAVDTDCPEGAKCTTIADGPGHVCRP